MATDVMVDVETTGTDPSHAGVIQISAVKFCLETKEIDHNFFDRCLQLAPGRFWDQETLNWWRGQGDVLDGILARAEPPRDVIQAFQDWLLAGVPVSNVRFWAKPISFDWPFVASYFRQFDIALPLHYRNARDVNTYLWAKGHQDTSAYWKAIGFHGGDEHNALFDCLNQINGLFRVDEKLS